MKELERLGIPESIIKSEIIGKLTGASVLTVVCGCGATLELKISSIKRTISRVGFYRCISCGMSAKHQDPAYQASHRDGIVKSWTDDRKQVQSEISKNLWQDSDFNMKVTDSSTKTWQDPDKLKIASERTKLLWQGDSYVQKQEALSESRSEESKSNALEMWSSPDYRAKQEIAKSNPDHVDLQRKLAVERWKNPDYRNSVSESMKEYISDPDVRKNLSEKIRLLWQDPDYRRKQELANSNEEYKKLKSDNAKKQWSNPETRRLIALGLAQYGNGARDSIIERIAQNVLSSLQIEYVRHHIVGYFEFDLFIPSHNILIECNGEYWHSRRMSQDAAKFTYIDTYFPEYKVLYLWERDFLNPELIHHKLAQALGLEQDSHKIYDFELSDIIIRPMDPDDILPHSYHSACVEFLQSYHNSGYGRSAEIIYGAFLKEILIGVCKFSTPTHLESITPVGISKRQVLELDKLCIHPQYDKDGFKMWMVAKCCDLVFSESLHIDMIISFSGSSIDDYGMILSSLNWVKCNDIVPDHHYTSADGFAIQRKNLQTQASRMKKTESEYAASFDYVKTLSKSKVGFCLKRST